MANYKRYYLDNSPYFITTNTVDRRPIFHDIHLANILMENIDYYRAKMKFLFIGYVIMPNHFHAIFIPQASYTISDIMRNIKYHTAKDIHIHIQGRSGPGPDLRWLESGQIWQARFYDEVIENDKELIIKLDYIHYNPVKSGLTQDAVDYKYSSARNYYLNDHSIIKIDHIN